jgi:hypothetical protein
MDTTNAVSTGEPNVARATEEPAGAEAAHRLVRVLKLTPGSAPIAL